MIMSPRLHKVALTAHVTSSVGWLGSVAGFFVLAITGVTSQDSEVVRAAYLAMELVAWYVIVPLSLASLLTGLVQALGTKWGLFRHYWIVFKLVINVASNILLLVHLQVSTHLADVAAQTTLASGDYRPLRLQLVADAGYAVVALLAATTLSVYKPRGLTPYGWRKQQEQRRALQRRKQHQQRALSPPE